MEWGFGRREGIGEDGRVELWGGNRGGCGEGG